MKYYIKDTRQEVHPGQVIKLTSEEKTPYGKVLHSSMFPLNEENIKLLLKDGILIETDKAPIPMDPKFYMEKLRAKLGWPVQKFTKIITDLSGVAAGPVFSMLMKEVAITIDKQYPDHISKSPQFFFVSMATGLIHKMETVPTYAQHISLFRTKKDAEMAVTILKDFHQVLFPSLYAKGK